MLPTRASTTSCEPDRVTSMRGRGRQRNGRHGRCDIAQMSTQPTRVDGEKLSSRYVIIVRWAGDERFEAGVLPQLIRLPGRARTRGCAPRSDRRPTYSESADRHLTALARPMPPAHAPAPRSKERTGCNGRVMSGEAGMGCILAFVRAPPRTIRRKLVSRYR